MDTKRTFSLSDAFHHGWNTYFRDFNLFMKSSLAFYVAMTIKTYFLAALFRTLGLDHIRRNTRRTFRLLHPYDSLSMASPFYDPVPTMR
jgi:hypothetical protein